MFRLHSRPILLVHKEILEAENIVTTFVMAAGKVTFENVRPLNETMWNMRKFQIGWHFQILLI